LKVLSSRPLFEIFAKKFRRKFPEISQHTQPWLAVMLLAFGRKENVQVISHHPAGVAYSTESIPVPYRPADTAAGRICCYIQHQQQRSSSSSIGCCITSATPAAFMHETVINGFRYVQHVRPSRVPQKRGPHRAENVEQQLDIFQPVRPLRGVLRHLKFHSVQHDIL